jgi:GDP-6-deoxy-D-talose 4-dehydrogenase
MRVAITGIDGFTGRYLIDELSRCGIASVPIEADLLDPSAINYAIAAAEFDAVIHLAGIAFAGSGDWQSYFDVNQIGTYNLLDAIARKRSRTRCVIASSGQVYGRQPTGLISEDMACAPIGAYALSKYTMELGATLWRDRLEIIVTRPFNYTGVGQEIRYLIPKIVDHVARRSDTIELGNIFVQRDFGDVRSVAKAYRELVTIKASELQLDDSHQSTVNIASGAVQSIDHILTRLEHFSGHRPNVIVNPAFVRPNEVEVLGGSIKRLQRLCPTWSPNTLDDTLQWMLADAMDRISQNH